MPGDEIDTLKVATPATAFTVVVPPSTPAMGEPALIPMIRVTDPEKALSRVLPAVRASTWIDGAIVLPAIVLAGCTKKPRWVAVTCATVMVALLVLLAGLRSGWSEWLMVAVL